MTTPYDPFAWFYNRYWGGSYVDKILPVIEKYLLQDLPSDATILDLCCGTGQLAAALAQRGYTVIGVDNSREMLAYARENAPGLPFALADATSFSLPRKVHAALSTFDSLNHILTLEDLTKAFACVRQTLLPGGSFLFDMNMAEGFVKRWSGSFSYVESDNVLIARSSHDEDGSHGHLALTMFRLVGGLWQREDVVHHQKAYTRQELQSALGQAGFVSIQVLNSDPDLAWWGPADAPGRLFLLAVAP